MTQAITSSRTLSSDWHMTADEFFVVRDGDSVRSGLLLEDEQLRAHLVSRGALTVNPSGTISVTFVGFAIWKSRIVLFLPKTYPIPADGDETACSVASRLTLRVLRKYSHNSFSREPDARRLLRSLSDPETSRFALATWLADDFAKHGLYRRTRNKLASSGNGIVDWHRTISNKTAYMSDGSAIYLDCITREKVSDNSHFVTRLHLTTLMLCKRRYRGILNLDDRMLENEGVMPLEEGPLSQLGPMYLARELRHAYADRSIQLFRVLEFFLKDNHPASATTFEIYGTSYFEHVWQEICATIIGNDIVSWSQCIPNPLWRTNSGCQQEAATLRPDIVRTYQSNGVDAVLLADAKYYSLTMPPNLCGNPGIGDVIKQLVYELAIVGECKNRGVKFSGNFFIFPQEGQSDFFSQVGTVSYPGISAGPIHVGYMDISKAMARYASGKCLTECEIATAFG